MTGERDHMALAAEHALGLLSGDELAEAQRLMAFDPQFATEVARWRGRLAPLADELGSVAPPEGLWSRIEARIGNAGPANDNVAILQQRVKRWRAIGGGMTAIAASLALVLVWQVRLGAPPQVPVQRSVSVPMVAMLGDEHAMKVVASWAPDSRQLVLAVAGDMPADPAHSHELWVIPAGGKPRSLGTMPSGKQMHMRLADALATLLQQGATIAISVEPPGGSKTGAPTGPVVASGALHAA
ncbi:MAG: anti-sigma factor [Sphingomonas sp.]|nr:anti-sigma factor [Sphingomonas sp.]